MSDYDEFKEADIIVMRAVKRIESAIDLMLSQTATLNGVAPDYVVERLIIELMKRNPEALDYLNRKTGTATMRITNALMDWRDTWADR